MSSDLTWLSIRPRATVRYSKPSSSRGNHRHGARLFGRPLAVLRHPKIVTRSDSHPSANHTNHDQGPPWRQQPTTPAGTVPWPVVANLPKMLLMFRCIEMGMDNGGTRG